MTSNRIQKKNPARRQSGNGGRFFTLRAIARIALALLFASSLIAAASAQGNNGGNNGLFTINNPGGGQVVYGPMTHITTLPEAMGAMLHNVHGHFGDKPQIAGKIVQSKDGSSLAAFFTLTDKNGKGEKIAGMAIVVAPKGASGAAAVLYDHSDRFGKTEPVLLSKLNEAWQKQSPPKAHVANTSANTGPDTGRAQPSPASLPAPSAPHQSSPVQPLHNAANGDNTGSVGLPAGWQITGGGGGAVHASGPKGEAIHYGVMIQNVYDPNNPGSRGMINYMSKGSTPYYVCSPSDMVTAFRCLQQQVNQKQHKPVPTLSDVQVTRMQPNQYVSQAVLINCTMDHHDGRGPMTATVQLGATREGPQGMWAMNISQEEIPVQLAEQEWPTVRAMWASYRQNGKAINGELQTELHQRQAVNDANTASANARSQANDARNKSIDDNRTRQSQQSSSGIDAQRDEQDWQSKIFQNYTLDQTVVRTADDEYHIHTDYPTAAALVQGNPNHFEYVPNQQLMKGVDW
jgi:hypothetical protein